MKINKILLASLVLITTESFAFEGYDYSPVEDNNSYSSYSDNNENYNESSYGYENRYSNSEESQRDYPSRFRRYPSATKQFVGAGKAFVFDPKELTWAAYYNGSLINSGRASGGRHYCPDIGKPCRTPVGVFYVGRKGGADCQSNKYPIGRGHAPMPYCMFFKGGFAIHGSWAVPDFNASHGCIRVHPQEARWLNQAFMSPGTRVIVKSYN